uniref:Uncharacterized protein n=1 Tax=Arundo donax TaxID=35708 RepID=A0A0A9HSX1_ARUDO
MTQGRGTERDDRGLTSAR